MRCSFSFFFPSSLSLRRYIYTLIPRACANLYFYRAPAGGHVTVQFADLVPTFRRNGKAASGHARISYSARRIRTSPYFVLPAAPPTRSGERPKKKWYEERNWKEEKTRLDCDISNCMQTRHAIGTMPTAMPRAIWKGSARTLKYRQSLCRK